MKEFFEKPQKKKKKKKKKKKEEEEEKEKCLCDTHSLLPTKSTTSKIRGLYSGITFIL
jgi:hypothetical protein